MLHAVGEGCTFRSGRLLLARSRGAGRSPPAPCARTARSASVRGAGLVPATVPRRRAAPPPRDPRVSTPRAASDAEAMSAQDQKTLVESMRQKAEEMLIATDETGLWTVATSLLVVLTFLAETTNQAVFGGWDVLYRDDLSPQLFVFPVSELQATQQATNIVFALEFALRAWVAKFSPAFLSSPFTIIDLVSCLPPFLGMLSIPPQTVRILRLGRVLRLLRLLNRSPNSVLFGVFKSDDTGLQVVGIVVEFTCIFVVAAGLIFDLEVGVNDNVHTLGDTLYWAILTLTGIGQPFEVVTPGGKIATVLSIAVALVTVPGQLAKLAATTSGRMMYDMMLDEEEEEAEAEDRRARQRRGMVPDSGPLGLGVGAAVQTVRRAQQRGGGASRRGRAAREEDRAERGVQNGARQKYRRSVVDDRPCVSCSARLHDRDADYCKTCGSRLPKLKLIDTEEAPQLTVRPKQNV